MDISQSLLQLLDSLIGEGSKYLAALTDIRPFTTFRFNPLKHTVEFQKSLLSSQGFRFDKMMAIPWAARLYGQTSQIGRSFSHFVGHIYIQDLASMLPVIVLDPKPGEKVLDLCAAPGSKTTQLAAAMKNQGVILANDVSVNRIRGLIFNLRRMGVKNTVVCKGFGEQYGNLYFETFQRVLVDPPCSALGTLHKSPEVLSWWTPGRSEKLARIQFRLLESGLKALKPGGILTYSTCTLTPWENEQVVDLALKKFPIELEQICLEGVKTRPGLTHYEKERFDGQLSRAIRIYPWDNRSEGFFLTRLRKLESFGKKNEKRVSAEGMRFLPDQGDSVQSYLTFLADYYGIPESALDEDHFSLQQDLYCSSAELSGFPLSSLCVKAGLPVAHVRACEALLSTEGTHLFGHLATRRTVRLSDLEALQSYVNRDCSRAPSGDLSRVLVLFEDKAIGHAVSHHGKLLSRFPRTSWRFQFCAP